MVRHVFVEVREDQKQLEHAVALLGIGLARVRFEILYDGERVRQKPFQIARTHRASLAGAIEGVIRAKKRFVEKMIEAELFGRQRGRNGIRTPSPAATSRDRCVHG